MNFFLAFPRLVSCPETKGKLKILNGWLRKFRREQSSCLFGAHRSAFGAHRSAFGAVLVRTAELTRSFLLGYKGAPSAEVGEKPGQNSPSGATLACFTPRGTNPTGTQGEKRGTWLGRSWEGDGCSRRGCSVSPGCSAQRRGQGGSEGLWRLPRGRFGVAAPAPAQGHADTSQGWRSSGSSPPPHCPPRGGGDRWDGGGSTHRARLWRELWGRFATAARQGARHKAAMEGAHGAGRAPAARGEAVRGCSSTGWGGYGQHHDGFSPHPQTPSHPLCHGLALLDPSSGQFETQKCLFFQVFCFRFVSFCFFFFLQNLLPVPADGAWPPPELSTPSIPKAPCAVTRRAQWGTRPCGATPGPRGRTRLSG